jgi:hypothetical protein
MKNFSSVKSIAGDKREGSVHWQETARKWQLLGPPLRPSPQDIEFFKDGVQEWIHHYGKPRVLLLGVTPEIYNLPWLEGTSFLAVDHSQAMIDAVWPGPKEGALCVDWLSLQLPDSSRDIILCDGGLHLLTYPWEQQQLVRILQAILSDQGLFIIRLYAPPTQQESPDVVLKDLLEGRISNLNILKLRLGMSLLESAAEGVALGMIWQLIHEVAPDLERLASRIGWSVDHMLVINTFRGSTDRFYFVTVNQVIDLFCNNPGGFEVHRLRVPSYELGEQCPTILLQRCSNAPVSVVSG